MDQHQKSEVKKKNKDVLTDTGHRYRHFTGKGEHTPWTASYDHTTCLPTTLPPGNSTKA